jgi:alcohol dehydrogenase
MMAQEARDLAKDAAKWLLTEWKWRTYVFGLGCLDRTGPVTGGLARRALVVANSHPWLKPTVEVVTASLRAANVKVAGRVEGARPNSPREDVFDIQAAIVKAKVDAVVAIGGGSTIDASKAAGVLATFEGNHQDIEPYFGQSKVTGALEARGRRLPALVAVQTASGSGAHLTKYSNITDTATSQKKLIIDGAIVPTRAVFDYAVTRTASGALTTDGAFDGIGHLAEAYYGAGPETIDQLEAIAKTGVELIVSSVARAVESPDDLGAREALGLGTDMGGYAIMIGSTSGPHLNSFSMVDILAHGRACAVLQPYYTVLFAPAIKRQLRVLGEIYARHGFIRAALNPLGGRDLGLVVAEGMMGLSRTVGFPTTLGEVPGFTGEHVARALAAAKDPQLASKLQAMPTPMSADQVDEFMGSVLEAARTGELRHVRNLPQEE